LDKTLSDDAIAILVESGLQQRFPKECNTWSRRQVELKEARATRIREMEAQIEPQLKSEEARLLGTLRQVLADRVLASFPYVMTTYEAIYLLMPITGALPVRNLGSEHLKMETTIKVIMKFICTSRVLGLFMLQGVF
jgi:hypothetical protein